MDRRRRTAPARVDALEPRKLMSVAPAAIDADRFEPNDSYAAATDLGTLGDRTESNLSIHAPGNNDYFKFKAAASGTVHVVFTFDQALGDVDTFLLDTDLLLMDSSVSSTGTERLDHSVTGGQSYFIKVIGYNGATNPSYSMAIDGPGGTSTGDGDDQISEARTVGVANAITDSIASSNDVDLYKLTVTANETVQFDVDRTSGSGLDSYLRLFNSSGTELRSNNDANAPGENVGTPRESYISYTFTTAGTYYVGVSGNPNSGYNPGTGAGDVAGSTGGYTLRLTSTTPPPPVGDPDDQVSEARSISVGGSVTDAIADATDVDLFKFTVSAGQRVGFDVDLTSGSALDSFVRVFNSSGSRITSNDNAAAPGETAGRESYVEYTFATAGTYYVGVSGSPNSSYNASTGAGDVAGSTGGYKLSLVNRTPAAAVAPSALAPTAPSLKVADAGGLLVGRIDSGLFA